MPLSENGTINLTNNIAIILIRYCQRLNRLCIWSPPSRSGRPARITAESEPNARKKRRKRASKSVEMTPEGNGRSDCARELVYPNPGSTVAHPPPPPPPLPPPPPAAAAAAAATVGIAEVPPPSGPPSIAEWNMFDIFSFPIPHDNLQENVIPPLSTPHSVIPPMPSLTDFLQLPAHGLAGLSTQPGVLEDKKRTLRTTRLTARHQPRALRRQLLLLSGYRVLYTHKP
ncbi:uncharacterized protein BO87DRAFT_432790 [Aspergillus neoniger CBS 115656]|uniref:Uncharacterized protein n=1 Tax=Aspergillus neoniger (strain CBS 115656) TaxID=1448310 RepID=A0A318YVF4_ASPNB|nr:hypothetical protein BO87DRAFT_432790 [Aspergillus neoniger CBS 115656]PYH35910.1 hypothetical protein BO87DRAFT_432790 [Aspergillus neoniger CBS 115656]